MIYSNRLVTSHLKMGTVVFAGISTEKCHFTFVCMSIMSSMQLYFNKAVLYGLTGKKSFQLFYSDDAAR